MRLAKFIVSILIAAVLFGCGGSTSYWVYPGKGWTVVVDHYTFPDRVYHAEYNTYYRAPEGYRILALWVTVENLDDRFSYDLRDEVSSWRVVNSKGLWATLLFPNNHERADGLQTQLPFVYGQPRSGYVYFRVANEFDVTDAILEFRFYGAGQGHLVIVDLSEV